MAKKNVNVSSEKKSLNDNEFMALVAPHLKTRDRAACVAACAAVGITEAYMNSRLSRIRGEMSEKGVTIPEFKRGRATSKDSDALALEMSKLFGSAE